jgi:hypothetical protein
MSDDRSPSHRAALFLQLVLGLQQSAMMALGKLMNPLTRKVETHLEMARDTIDTLAALEDRTRGNLEPDEARVLKQVLTDLRMNYVEELKKASAPKTGDPAAARAEGTPRGSADNDDDSEPGVV